MQKVLPALLLACLLLHPARAQTLTTAFTYQGYLEEGGAPAAGEFDLRFHLYGVEFGGTPLETQLQPAVMVSSGNFTVQLDYGDNEINDGNQLWLEIEVSAVGSGVFTPLAPRQRVAATPYALYARRARQASAMVSGQGATIHAGPQGETWFVQPGGSSAHRFAVEPFGGIVGSAEFVIDNMGRVGIGRFNPTQALDVDGAGRFSTSGTDDSVFLGSNGNAFVELRGSGTPFIDFSNDAAADFDMRLKLSGNDALTIEGGRVGIGGTMTNPAFKLDLPNVSGPDGQGRANAWVTYSSVRWKEGIATIDGATEMLRGLRGVEFDWKQEHGGGHGLGFVAEEVGTVLPALVEWEEGGPYAESLNYLGIVPVLVEAFKEQLVIIERQEEELALLKELVCADRTGVEPCL